MNKRVVLVTGGSEGMGLASAKEFLESGDEVIITARDKARLDELRAKYPDLHTYVSDAGNSQDRKSLMQSIKERFGRIDVLFSNVGIGLFKPLSDISEDEFDKVVNVNYKGTFFMIQEALKLMPENSRIVVNASWTYHRGLYSSSLYGSTKAAIAHLVKTLAIELAPRHININSVSPGYINTKQFNEEMLGEEGAKQRKAQVPLKRFGKPEEVAKMVHFLASNEADYITGQDLLIDGGLTAVHNY